MSFLNPGFLSALALVTVPLLIHLLRRRKLKVVRWAAMEFLRQSQRRQRRRLRIEELILLALRMLIIALAVLAFARPVLRALGVPLLSQNARIYAVLVLDNSFSMDHQGAGDGKRSFDRAKAAAEDILTHILRPGDSASLVLLSDRPEAAVSAPSFDLDLVRERVRAARVGDRATDYLAAAQAVNRLLKASPTPDKEVYWLTDDQANAWATSQSQAARAVWQEIGRQARVTWVSVGAPAGARDNLAVQTPTLGRELVTPQVPLQIETQIVNYGAKPRNNVLVHLMIDGKLVDSTRVSLPARKGQIARFAPHLFSRPGIHTGQIVLDDAAHADGLEHDNAVPFVVLARDRIRVLVQDMTPTGDPARSESYYLLSAVESLSPRLHTGEGLSGISLGTYDAILLSDLTALSAADRRALAEYVRTGGGALLFPGPHTDARRVNADLAGLLPAKLGARRTLPETQALTLNPATIAHPALARFQDTANWNLGSARFTTYYPLEPVTEEADPNAVQVMLRFSNGDPALVERRIGMGRIVLAASSASAKWNEWPLRSSYPPVIYQLLSYLSLKATARRNLHQDEPFFLALPVSDANKPVRVTAPDGRTTVQNSVLDARGVTFTYLATRRAGLYRVAVSGAKTEDAFAVGLPPDESDLAPADPTASAVQAGLPAQRLAVAATPQQLQASVRRSRYGAEMWRPLIWAVLPLLFLESLLAQRFGRRG
ncbi:MAG TPA: BatA domain-containing protein [Chthonomonadaceae bacterium]|nr:BatA domain-containing protein [Chthonomonadaceae bacterium]